MHWDIFPALKLSLVLVKRILILLTSFCGLISVVWTECSGPSSGTVARVCALKNGSAFQLLHNGCSEACSHAQTIFGCRVFYLYGKSPIFWNHLFEVVPEQVIRYGMIIGAQCFKLLFCQVEVEVQWLYIPVPGTFEGGHLESWLSCLSPDFTVYFGRD